MLAAIGTSLLQRRLCRRQWLRLGCFAAGQLFAQRFAVRDGQAAEPIARRPPRAKAAIILLLEGGMSHLDTWDPKPDAPAEIRGEFRAIATANPALRIAEHMPLLAQTAQLFSVVRSVQSPARNHNSGLHLVLTGYDNPLLDAGAELRNLEHPCQGSVYAQYLAGRLAGDMPPFAVIPNRTVLGGENTLATAARLGPAYEPLETGEPSEVFEEPLAPPAGLFVPTEITPERLEDRRALLGNLERLQRDIEHRHVNSLGAYRDRAFRLIGGGRLARAFDLTREPEKVRRRYGAHQQGQGCLLARRLVESGVGYVLVNLAFSTGNAWDTHADNFRTLRNSLLPPMDQAVSALLQDLQACGLLDQTIVLMLSEMGRTPRINKDAGRDHHPDAFSAMIAGGGIKGGHILGATTRGGERVHDRPVPVSDLLATVNELLGVDSQRVLAGDSNRPLTALPPEAVPVVELLG